jgi:serine/threonine protein kinase/tetratricopeptide (TPR) repeat protein
MEPGDRLGHYEILQKLGSGGMGEVYRARDLNLGREAAIKVLHREVAEDRERLRRFEQEARAASALNHPNIVTIYEIGQAEGTPYIAMELVQGRTLRELLGPRPLLTRRALQLAAQATDGLARAHAAGIVHRDLKPENIIITRDGLVKILDFGLAKLVTSPLDVDSDEPTRPGTTPGVLLGTVGYMSPEQALGSPVDFRSDQFACGAILYEMATGRRAFQRESPVQTLSAIIEDPPEPIARLNPACPAPFRWIVERCLAKDPLERFGSTHDLARALEDVLEHLSEVEPERRLPLWHRLDRRQRVIAVALGALGVLAVGGTLLFDARIPSIAPGAAPAPSPAAPVMARRSVAVLGFKNLSRRPEAAWLSTALAEMLTTELAAGGRLRTIPGENVGRMKIDLSLSEAESLAADTLRNVGKNLGTDMVLLGSYLSQRRGQVRLDIRLQEVGTGETIVALAENGSEDGLVDLVTRAGSRLRTSMGVDEPPAGEAAGLRAGVPSNLEAQRLYAEGVAKLRVLDALAAKELLLKAVKADPKAPLVHSALAEAWSTLGYDNNAAQEAQQAFERSEGLSREERLSIEARYRESAREWDKAIGIHRALYAFFPDNLEYGLRLVAAQSSAGKASEALATLGTLRKLPVPVSHDPRIDLAEASVAQSLSDFKRELLAANAAAAKSAALGARLLVARARILEAYTLHRLGELTKAMAAAQEAHRTYEDAGDQGGVASALNRIGGLLWDRGELVAARQSLEEALAIRRQIGYQHGVGSTLSNLGLTLWKQGDLAGALRRHQEAETIFRELGDKPLLASILVNASAALYDKGDFPGVKKRGEEAIGLCREIGDTARAAEGRTIMGQALAAEGNLAAAKAAYLEALPVLQQSGSRTYAAVALFELGQVLAAEGDLAGARTRHEEALAIRRDLGERINEGESRVALGALSIEEGRPGDAEAPARDAAALFGKEQAPDKEGLALALLARALLAQGRSAEALEAAERAAALTTKSQNPHVRVSVAAATARVRAARGLGRQALAALDASHGAAARLGLVGLQLETQLAMGEIEAAMGKVEAGRARLAQLEKDARARGFGLVARKSAAARVDQAAR